MSQAPDAESARAVASPATTMSPSSETRVNGPSVRPMPAENVGTSLIRTGTGSTSTV